MGRAGIVLGLECSRLARNSADWHQLLELCAMTGTLICDEDGLYDPRDFNDRLLLGMKGQMSEAELHFIKARLRGGVLSKARRGELITPLPVGLVYDSTDHVVLDPDQAVQQALRHLFGTFAATGSATACVKAFRAAGLLFPWRHLKGPSKGELDWKPSAHHTVLRILHNPRYAGAFTYGRHGRGPAGIDSRVKLPREQWISFIPDTHPGYLTLAEFDTNQARLAQNAAAHGRDRAAGPPREGTALLQGMIACGKCGKRMTVRYHRRRGRDFPTYVCQREGIDTAQPICASIPGADLDTRIGQLLIDTLSPLAVEAAFAVSAELDQRATEADRMRATVVERTQYRADLARRRYLTVDPANRLVAETLEADWNTALRELQAAQRDYDTARTQQTGQLTDTQRARIHQLVTDLPAIWNDPATPARERKRIARLLLTDATVSRDRDTITAHIRFPAGQHTTLTMPVPKTGPEARRTPAEVVTLIDELLDHHISGEIADILNQRGLLSGTGEPFHRLIIDHIIRAYRLRTRRQRLRATGMLTPAEMATRLGVAASTLKHWRRAGLVTAVRYNDKGESLYHPTDPENPPERPHIGRPPKTR
ncbi:recombinase family protein [Nocardia sp. NPDC050630]|uniref:recombinase family protein n=1 Tax=Nocardia sp. NPDC050630 TaxID=3364321 RepID=UPI0037BA1090